MSSIIYTFLYINLENFFKQNFAMSHEVVTQMMNL